MRLVRDIVSVGERVNVIDCVWVYFLRIDPKAEHLKWQNNGTIQNQMANESCNVICEFVILILLHWSPVMCPLIHPTAAGNERQWHISSSPFLVKFVKSYGSNKLKHMSINFNICRWESCVVVSGSYLLSLDACQTWVQTLSKAPVVNSLSKKCCPYFSVLVGRRNRFELDLITRIAFVTTKTHYKRINSKSSV